jgi:hypothetical protein
MKRMPVGAVALSVVTCVGLASAAELQGTVQAAESAEHVVVLEDGTKLWLAKEVIVGHLREGVTVKLSYEERDGKHVVTRIDNISAASDE